MIRNAIVPTFQSNLVAKVEERADFKTSDAPYSLENVPLERRGHFIIKHITAVSTRNA
jgi:hypothetical protein